MREAFYALADALMGELAGEERLLLGFRGEESDFVRLNHNRIRQAGHVVRRQLTLDLIEDGRHAMARADLSGDREDDLAELRVALQLLRAQRRHLPEDPYLSYPIEARSSERADDRPVPDSREALQALIGAAEGLDLVGIWASGRLHAGVANSLGQRHWHSSVSFNLDWSAYHQGDKAVKGSYAGTAWASEALLARMAGTRRDLAVMAQPPMTIPPGRYRVYLAPAALLEILEMLAWGGFDLRSRRTGQTPLLRMTTEGRRLHTLVTLVEDHRRGLAPGFTGEGFAKPDCVGLIKAGGLGDCLVDARNGKEFGMTVNASVGVPESLEMVAGSLRESEVLEALGTGLYISRLWYLNYSDRGHARLTGMTRFACFWVERGRVRGPVDVMRFDDSVFHLLGDSLEALTAERELILDPESYGGRSHRSALLPGALIDGMTFTL